jgi:GDPmannose 4,6-dehydratase
VRALITGVTGQDGSYLADLLLSKGYDVHGLVHTERPAGAESTHAAGPGILNSRVHLHTGDLNDAPAIAHIIAEVAPTEVYNLGSMSNVHKSFDLPAYTASTNGGGTLRLLDGIRAARLECKFFQASSSELFGGSPPPQSETSPFRPRSPYGASKLFSHWLTMNAREAEGLFAVSGIMFNHESPRRGPAFVTRKITRAVARIKAGLESTVTLGNLDTVRDWGYAPEFVEAMWLTLQHDEPTDFVFATGVGTTVGEFAASAFAHAGLDWHDHVRIDESLVRPPEQFPLIGDPKKAESLLGWKAQTHARELARIMVDADIALLGTD